MQDRLSEDLKTLFLAGVGAAAITAEKARALVGELVEKGRLTVEQGRVLNEELHRRNRTVPASPSESSGDGRDGADLLRDLDHMSPEDLAALKARLAAMEAAEESHGKSKD